MEYHVKEQNGESEEKHTSSRQAFKPQNISYPSYGGNLHLGDFPRKNEASPLWTNRIKSVINNLASNSITVKRPGN